MENPTYLNLEYHGIFETHDHSLETCFMADLTHDQSFNLGMLGCLPPSLYDLTSTNDRLFNSSMVKTVEQPTQTE